MTSRRLIASWTMAHANVNHRNGPSMATPLHLAAATVKREILSLLLARGANPNAKDAFAHNNMLVIFVQVYSFGVTSTKLLPLGRRNTTSSSGWDPDSCFLLLDMGADLKARDNRGATPLHLASSHDHLSVCIVLLDMGAALHSKDGFGATPLHWAAKRGSSPICKLLLDRGADLNATDYMGRKPGDLATEESTRRLLSRKALFGQKAEPSAGKPSVPPPDDVALIVGKISGTDPTITTSAWTASAVKLSDVSVQQISTILENLGPGFSSMVVPFKNNDVDGSLISIIDSFRDVLEIGEGAISPGVAKAFFEGHVRSWQSSGLIPIELLEPRYSRPLPVPSAQKAASQPMPAFAAKLTMGSSVAKKAVANVALEDISIQELSVVLENLSFSSLVEPFQTLGMSGRLISRIENYQDIMEIGKGKISKVVARTFYEDYVVQWQKSGRIPRNLLQPSGALASRSKQTGHVSEGLRISDIFRRLWSPSQRGRVQTPLVFSSNGGFQEQASWKVYEHQYSSRIEVLEAPMSRRLFRLEYGADRKLLTAMSANVIFISNERDVPLDPTIKRMNMDVRIVGGGEMWIERCPTSKGFCALHFSSKKIELFDRILDIAHGLDLKPFPNYFILGRKNKIRERTVFINKRSKKYNSWNSFNDIGLPVDFRNDNPPIKVDSPDPIHGTHVVGIIGATAPAVMKGLCSPATAELRLHVMFPSEGPPVPDIQYCFND
eukprot:gene34831-45060_t